MQGPMSWAGSGRPQVCYGPATLAVAAIATSVLATGASVYGGMQSANAQSKAAEYQSEVDQQNQANSLAAARDAIARGQVAAQQEGEKGAQLLARQRASLASNGVDVNSGSAVQLQTDTAGQSMQDVLTTRYNFDREAYNDQLQGASYGNQANLASATASNISAAEPLAAAGTILGGASKVAGDWYYMNKGPAGYTSGSPLMASNGMHVGGT